MSKYHKTLCEFITKVTCLGGKSSIVINNWETTRRYFKYITYFDAIPGLGKFIGKFPTCSNR